MSDSFNGYHVWLGIPVNEQPPNHYRLLGISIFETDRDVIEHAADRQMAHVRTFQSGRHGSLSQQILNELAAASVCLLNAEKKTAYDELLRAKLTGVARAAPVTMAQPVSPASMLPPVGVAPASLPTTGSHSVSGSIPQAKPLPMGRSIAPGQAVAPAVRAVTPPSAPVAQPTVKPVPRVVPASAGNSSAVKQPSGTSALDLDSAATAYSAPTSGMRLKVKRRKYRRNTWQSPAIVGTLAGVAVIVFIALYAVLKPFLSWSLVEQIFNGPGAASKVESTAPTGHSAAPAAPRPTAPASATAVDRP